MKKLVRVGTVVTALLFVVAGSVSAQCVGDCNEDGAVTVDELVSGVNIALGAADLSTCPAFDGSEDGSVTVDELVTGVNNALGGCPVEEAIRLDCPLSNTTQVALQTTLFPLGLAVAGELAFTVENTPDENGRLPVIIKKEDMNFDPVAITGMLCACVSGKEIPEFGEGNVAKGFFGCGEAGLEDVDYEIIADHNIGEVGVDGFTEQDCLDAGGEVEEGPPNTDEPHTGVCNYESAPAFEGMGATGSMLVQASLAIAVIPDGGACVPNCAIPEMGPDCTPCTDDDVDPLFEKLVPLTTGTASGKLYNADNLGGKIIYEDPDGDEFEDPENPIVCGAQPCRTVVTGMLGDCDALDSENPGTAMSGAAMAGTLVNFDTSSIGDNVVTFSFQCEQ